MILYNSLFLHFGENLIDRTKYFSKVFIGNEAQVRVFYAFA